MARFKFKGATYDLVDTEDLSFEEADDLERYTAFNLVEGKVAPQGLVWISVRRRYPQTTWDDIKQEKFFTIEWMADEDDDRLPPTSNGAGESSTADALLEPLAPTDTGSPG